MSSYLRCAVHALSILCVAYGCGNPGERWDLSPSAYNYMESAVRLMRQNYLHKDKVNWIAVRDSMYERTRGASAASECYDAIRYGLSQLDDKHCYFLSPREESERIQRNRTLPLPSSQFLEDRWGYLHLPQCGEDSPDYAPRLHELIRDLQASGVEGWIVDLRSNVGGNMWPMLAGIGPLLGEGESGGFAGSDGHVQAWSYVAGESKAGGKTMASAGKDPIRLDPLPWVAVLTVRQTASSGEAIAIAFKGRVRCRSFGSATFGASTSPGWFTLSDGARLVVSHTVMTDRSGTQYGGPVLSDQPVENDGSADPIVYAAMAWLEKVTSAER